MHNYKLTIQYDGGRYKGWQRLGDNDNTIQGKVERVLSEMVGETIEIIGCSRTDAGVHALGQIANFKIDQDMSCEEIQNYLNRYLPKDISVIKVDKVEENFHARYHAKAKTYLYKIWNKEYTNPFIRKYSMHVPEELNLSQMRLAANCFIGEHDFTAFSNAKSKKKTMVRQLYFIDISREGDLILVRICGNGFLYNMARWIVGTLIDVGLGYINPEAIPAIIASKRRDQTGNIADAAGLYLEEIHF